MDCFEYMTQPQRDNWKRGTGYVAEDERALPRPRHRQRDVTWNLKLPTQGQPLADIARTMGYETTQSKVAGESFEEAILRGCGYDTDAKVRTLEGRA